MKNAYLISVHTDPQQLCRLIESLYDARSMFFIHVDKKVDIDPFRAAIPLRLLESGFIVFTERVNTWWAGFSQVKYQTLLLQAVNDCKIKFDYVFFLTGLDYPLWSLDRMHKYFVSNSNKEYLCAMNVSEIMKEKFTLYHFFRDSSIRNCLIRRLIIAMSRLVMKIIPLRKPAYLKIKGEGKWPIYMSSACMALTYDCAMYVLKYITDKSFQKYFRYSYAPDELGIATIVMNSPYADNTIPYEYAYYRGTHGFAVTHEYEYNTICKVLTEADFDWLMNSNKMFARKLNTGISDKLVDMIENCRSKSNTH